MQTIDLTKPGDNYKIITFPDGEVHLELKDINRKEGVDVRCRITNAQDLFILMQLSDILKRQCVEIITLEILYLMGQRCDRLFDINRPFTLGIVADVINSMNAVWVDIREPHSYRILHMINNVDIHHCTEAMAKILLRENDGLLLAAPDKGAKKRYLSLDFAVICSKVRDEATGNLLDFKVEATTDVKNRELLLVDDLCDGGGTFVGLAPKLRELEPKTLNLAVTHAVQLNGIKRVAEVYDNVYITNSYKDWDKEDLPSNVTVM